MHVSSEKFCGISFTAVLSTAPRTQVYLSNVYATHKITMGSNWSGVGKKRSWPDALSCTGRFKNLPLPSDVSERYDFTQHPPRPTLHPMQTERITICEVFGYNVEITHEKLFPNRPENFVRPI